MIGALRGTVHELTERTLLLDVHDVIYELFVPAGLLTSLKPGAQMVVYVALYQRQEEPQLYGFSSLEERRFFELLLTVSGVGPRSALGVMGLADVASLEKTIGAGDAALLTKVSGVGKKTAERIVVELKEKLADGERPAAGTTASSVYDALARLGYSAREARGVLREIEPSGTVEDQVRAALKLLGKR